MPVAELARRLSADRLHVIVFGPGYGESVAVHVPDGGWLICDSLSGTGTRAGFVPAAELLSQRGEPAALLLLTHPHDDHVAGFDRLVNRFAQGPVGLLGAHLAKADFTEDDDATAILATSNRLKALAAIHRYWREYPEFKWLLKADGTTRAIGPGCVEVLHPDDAYLSAGKPDPAAAPNAYSTPVLVAWGATRIVLGADLPTAEWGLVLAATRDTPLAVHGGLKVSHHGSVGSLADDLVLIQHDQAPALVTPWHLGRGLLPKLGAGGGIDWLLARRRTVGLTSPGRALMEDRLPEPASYVQFTEAVQRRELPGGVGAIEVKESYDPDESWIALTFDRDGNLETVDRGRAARTIVRG